LGFDKNRKLWAFFGTGDREDPTDFSNPRERFYAIKDDGLGNYPRQEVDLKEVTSINTFTPDPTKKGWFIQLYKDGDGHQLEKVLAKPSLFNQLLYFTTYTHDDDADPCSAYRESEGIGMGKGLGYCDFDGAQSVCDGDIQFCEKPDTTRKFLLDQKSKEEGGGIEEELLNLNRLESLNMKSSNYKVLVVDDEEPMRKLIVTLLSQKGHQCVTVSNGLEALDKISGNKFDAVIADIVMPEMDGIVLIKELSKHYQSLPVMIMTGHTDEYSAETAIAAGAREFINKPFSIEEFIIRFHKMMHEHEILCQIEVKTKDIVFHLQRDSNEKTEKLKVEIEDLKNKLTSLYELGGAVGPKNRLGKWSDGFDEEFKL
jgi:CheY-like chemotaxis protein